MRYRFGLVAAMLAMAFCHAGFGQTTAKSELAEHFKSIAESALGKVGVAVELLETHESFRLNGREHFPMQSVYKAPIAMAVLHQVDLGTLKLEQIILFGTNDYVPKGLHSPLRDEHPSGGEMSISNLVWLMVAESDGSACDILLKTLHGPKVVTRYLSEIGLTNLIVATTENEMSRDESVQYQNWTTPEALMVMLRMLHERRGLCDSNLAFLMRCMTETPYGTKRIKGLLPAGTRVTHKTGSSRTIDGLTRATNDAGIITLPDGRHLAVVVLVSDSTADDATREAVMARIAKAAWDHWVKQAP